MNEQLVVRLGSEATDPVFWIVWSQSEKEIIASGELPDAEQLHTLTSRAGNRAITALVPAADVLLKWVTLPPKAGRKALSAIPFMLEDEITTDIDDQFFALGKKEADQQAVAVVQKQKIQSWLKLIADAGLHCDKMLPDVLALPTTDNSWSLLQLGQQIILRQDSWSGLQGELTWLQYAIEHHSKQQSSTLIISNYSDLQFPNLANVEMIQQELSMPMQVLALGAVDSAFNLLQGEFKPKKKRGTQIQKWRMAAVLGTIALLTTLIDKGVEVSQLSNQKQALAVQIQSEYKRAFPNAGRARDIKRKMKQELDKLQNGGSGVSLLTMLSQLSDAFASSQVKPQTMKFNRDRSELRLQAVARNYEALEQFKTLAESKGFEVTQGAINNKDSQVVGSLSIRS